MSSSKEISDDRPADVSARQRLLKQHPWVAFVLPLMVFLLVGSLEATPQGGPSFFGLIHPEYYPAVYTAKILLTTLALILVWPAYRVFPMRIHPIAIGVGVIGVFLWVGFVNLDIEGMLGLGWLTERGQRVAYNPLEALSHRPLLAYGFLAVRFFGLAVVIAVAEEMFLRGFLIRYVEDPDRWDSVSLSQVGWQALIAGTAVPMLMHPGELFAAMVWFSLVSWLMLRTGNIWDCITAHMVTNLLLGFYVMYSGNWQLW
ncbi:CAAX prenyl protease-related protein [Allorhodopirellula solitaria]|uniref:CAAX amino terminal protease self-immunity n=1 Tax=Allorhodopirellula solitaria TaxID=2527987 RepID=A0A5C5XV43_9BACT|nr:CAAX prenyl protease-related protein [Allorhodopirellula solitaria]TWT67186.1 CAAX amino terminal protease self- immunity [Allorhodopirellula solitaria]